VILKEAVAAWLLYTRDFAGYDTVPDILFCLHNGNIHLAVSAGFLASG